MLDSYKSLFFAQNPLGLALARKPIWFFLCTIHFERELICLVNPDQVETAPQIPATITATHRQTRTRNLLRVVENVSAFYTFPIFVFKTSNEPSLLFQRTTRAALFYDEEGKQVSISLQGDHRNLSSCSLQGNAFAPFFFFFFWRKCDSLVHQLK